MINNITKAVTELEKRLLKASDITYDGIDRLMRKIMGQYDVTAKELHFGFTKKHDKTPDSWIKMKRKLNEDHKEIKSGQRKDEEGYMARVELDTIDKAVDDLRKAIKKGDQQLPAWVQSKITKAADYIDTAADYLTSDESVNENRSFEIKPESHKKAKPKTGAETIRKMTTAQQETLDNKNLAKKVRGVDLPKFVESSIVDRILKSLNEEECGCEEEKGSVKGSKPVMSVENIASKHGVSSAIIQKQLKMGIKVEGEHTTNKEEAEGIALQHLAEKPDYYTKLKKVEKVQTESTIVTDLLGNPKFEFIDLVLPLSLKEARKMKGEDPCWKGYEMVGTKKKRGKTVPNCVPVTEATLPVQNGQVMQILFSWRGKMMSSQLFFPQVRIPNRKEVTDAIVKVYPDAKVLSYRVGNQNVGQPIIQLPNTKSKNFLLQNKTIGEEANSKKNFLNEEGPSLSVGRGEKLSVEAGGGLTAKGRERYNRATGSKLKAPVTGDVKKGSKAWKRRKNFCSRSRSWKGPRGLAARKRWKC